MSEEGENKKVKVVKIVAKMNGILQKVHVRPTITAKDLRVELAKKFGKVVVAENIIMVARGREISEKFTLQEWIKHFKFNRKKKGKKDDEKAIFMSLGVQKIGGFL